MNKVLSLACVSALAVSLVGCGGGDDAKKTGNYVTLAKENDVISMNSMYATDGMSLEMIAATVDGLETMNAKGETVPALAESYEVSDDGLTYTFKLRDAKWSNDEPVTADDFVFAWNYTIRNPKAEYAYLFTDDGACVKNANEIFNDGADAELGITAKDDKTLVVELSKKCPYFVSLMTFPVFYPVNEAFFNEVGDKYATSPDNLLASGPYQLVDWQQGKSLTLDQNKKYWDADAIQVDGINVNIIAEASTAALDFESGNTDFAKLNSTLVDKYKDTKEYQSFLEGYLWYLQYNYDNEVLQNENVRKAIGAAIDRQDLVENVLKDGSIAKGGFVPTAFTTGPDGKDYAETGTEYYTDYGKDALKVANEYWKKAKAELGKDEITLKLLYEPADPSKPAAEFIQGQLQKLDGLTIEMVSQEKNSRIEKQKQGDFDVVLTRWGPDYADPTTYLNLMITGNSYNYGNYSNPAYDAKMQEAADAATDQERWDLLHEAEDILMQDSPVVGLFQVGGATLVKQNVKGIESHAFGVPYIYRNLKVE